MSTNENYEADQQVLYIKGRPLMSDYAVVITEPSANFRLVEMGGYEVPYLEAYLRIDESENPIGYWVSLDRRMSCYMTLEQIPIYIPILAEAMAKAAGFSNFGAGSEPLPPEQVETHEQEWITRIAAQALQPCSPDQPEDWYSFLNNAVAVAAGYSHAGFKAKRFNPFKVSPIQLG